MTTTTATPRTDACPHCGCQTKDPFGMGKTIHNVENCKRNRELSEAKAEVERLKAHLRRAVEIAEDSTDSLMDWDENRRSETQRKNYAELEQLKATLNQDKK